MVPTSAEKPPSWHSLIVQGACDTRMALRITTSLHPQCLTMGLRNQDLYLVGATNTIWILWFHLDTNLMWSELYKPCHASPRAMISTRILYGVSALYQHSDRILCMILCTLSAFYADFCEHSEHVSILDRYCFGPWKQKRPLHCITEALGHYFLDTSAVRLKKGEKHDKIIRSCSAHPTNVHSGLLCCLVFRRSAASIRLVGVPSSSSSPHWP